MTVRTARLIAVFACIGLAGCGGPSAQVLLAPPPPDARVPALVGSLEVRDVSLPRYAASDDLVVLDDDGLLQTVSGAVWADTPERSMTLALADALGAITGARVAAEPWPFAQAPAAQVTVRVSQLLATANGALRLKGHYAIAPVNSGLADRSGQFDISVPVTDTAPAALAEAHGRAVSALAGQIAGRIAR